MGVNALGIALSSKFIDIKEITEKLNIVLEGPIEKSCFEKAISNHVKEDDVYFTQLEHGTIITTGIEFPLFSEGFSTLSEEGNKLTKFMYGDTSGVYFFEYFENGQTLRRKYVLENTVKQDDGKKQSIEYSGLTDDSLVLEMISQACGEEIFTIEPDTKSIKYKYISGKPISQAPPNSIQHFEQKKNNVLRKNRLIFFFILIHILLGISNLITSNQLLNKQFDFQISSYISLILYGVIGYFLLLRKNWMRIIFIVLSFISLPLSLLALKSNILLWNNLIQLGLSVFITVLLFNKELRKLYTQKQSSITKTPFNNISIKEILILVLGVILLQVGAADFILQADLIPIGTLTGIISGVFFASGIYLISRTLKKNYYRQQ